MSSAQVRADLWVPLWPFYRAGDVARRRAISYPPLVQADAPAFLAEYADRARAFVARATGLAPSLDEVGLAAADHYLTTVRETLASASEDKRATLLALVVPTLGALFGQIECALLDGAWTGSGPDPEALELAVGPLHFSPTAVVAEAIAQGPAPGYDATVHAPLGLRAALERALEGATPVSTEYYYSLTGRHETLVLLLDVVAATAAAGAPPPEPEQPDE